MQQNNYAVIHNHIVKIMKKVERQATGKIPFPYLVVSYGDAYAGTIYVWDCYHMALRFANDGNYEYLKYLVNNCLYYQTPNGFTPNCIHPDDGPREPRSGFHAQPFLAQSAVVYAESTGDYEWATGVFSKLIKYLEYYEHNNLVANGVFCWHEPHMSGFDNDAATNFHMPGEIVSPDLSSWLVMEYNAIVKLAELTGQNEHVQSFKQKASSMKMKINELFWFDSMDTYSSWNLIKGRHHFSLEGMAGDIGKYAFQSCSNIIPLYAGIATPAQAERMIRKYILAEKHFMSKYGIRSLSASSEYYNNAVWGNPPRFMHPNRLTNSNWQGPVWIPLSYFTFVSLNNYGFATEAEALAEKTFSMLATLIEQYGGWTENFCAETGKPLYAEKFASWNLLADMMKL
jgi:putative isomerase